MPSHDAVNDWRSEFPEVERLIARARDIGFDVIASDTLKIADDGSNDTYVDDEGNRRVDTDIVQRSKLRVETRLKLLAKWDPKRYGEKVQNDVNLTGQLDHHHTISDERRKELMAMKQSAIERRLAARKAKQIEAKP